MTIQIPHVDGALLIVGWAILAVIWVMMIATVVEHYWKKRRSARNVSDDFY
jgi:hypothetical protein